MNHWKLLPWAPLEKVGRELARGWWDTQDRRHSESVPLTALCEYADIHYRSAMRWRETGFIEVEVAEGICDRMDIHPTAVWGFDNYYLAVGVDLDTLHAVETDGPLCDFPECCRGVFARSYCHGHYNQLRYGQTLKPIRRLPRLCSVDDCTKRHFGLGYCKMHHTRVWRAAVA